MIPTLPLFLVGLALFAAGCYLGFATARWRVARDIRKLEKENGDRTLELLATRKHLRTVTKHMQSLVVQNGADRRELADRQASAERLQQQLQRASHTLTERDRIHFVESEHLKKQVRDSRAQLKQFLARFNRYQQQIVRGRTQPVRKSSAVAPDSARVVSLNKNR